MLPQLEYLAFNTVEEEPPTYDFRHSKLRVVDLCPWDVDYVWPWLSYLLEAIRGGRLPTLQVCRILTWQIDAGREDEFSTFCAAFEILGRRFEAAEGCLLVRAVCPLSAC